jgi:transposase
MFRSNESSQVCAEFVSIEALVPEDHLLRKIDATIDFSFIREKMRPLYCENNGRPCIDPVMLFKMLFVGYLFGIRSERRLIDEIKVNVAYRWFIELTLYRTTPPLARTGAGASTARMSSRRYLMQSSCRQWGFP